jgi:hypothetical protein
VCESLFKIVGNNGFRVLLFGVKAFDSKKKVFSEKREVWKSSSPKKS